MTNSDITLLVEEIRELLDGITAAETPKPQWMKFDKNNLTEDLDTISDYYFIKTKRNQNVCIAYWDNADEEFYDEDQCSLADVEYYMEVTYPER